MACFIFNAMHQHHYLSVLCNCPSSSLNLPCFSCNLALLPPKHSIPSCCMFKSNHADNRLHAAKVSATADHETPAKTADRVLENEEFMFARRNVICGGNSFKRCSGSGDGDGRVKFKGMDDRRGTRRRNGDGVDAENLKKLVKKSGSKAAEVELRVALDMCSKRGDVIGAIQLYDSALKDGVKIRQYHYTVLLYLCSSAAVGVVQPAKSGSVGPCLTALHSTKEVATVDATEVSETGGKGGDRNTDAQNSCSIIKLNSGTSADTLDPSNEVRVSEDVKEYALRRGFEIYQKMLEDKIPMNEAILTAVARMAMSVGDGDMAFDMVKQMNSLGINPKLRSYGPALMAFCASGEIDKAFSVEKHMLEHGVLPKEPELEALLRASVEAGKGDKVYYLLHKLRMTVRKVSASTAGIITRWFTSKAASRFGKTRWDKRVIEEATKNKGGGWHGQGWLGKGRWLISCTSVGPDAICRCCGEKLATVDLDPVETENFADSVASIAVKRDKDSSFQKFQKWLDYYGPFEAVIDGANVGLFSQKRFVPSKINSIVNGIRKKLPSKRWPLIVLHNKRIGGPKMDQAINKAVIEKWKNADALYATPTGSNDDWYWLYAAVRCKCLIVTNDEMRDHKFQLLGNDFFPRWKERHQVRFSFSDAGPVFHMPPPYSVVIQESVKGGWHIPIAGEHEHDEAERWWVCIRRGKCSKEEGYKVQMKAEEDYKNLRQIVSRGVFAEEQRTVLSEIEAAEKRGGCIIDFQI